MEVSEDAGPHPRVDRGHATPVSCRPAERGGVWAPVRMPRLLAVIAGCGILLTLTGTLRVGHALAQGAVTPASTKGAASLRATLPTVVLDADSAGVLLSPVMAVLDDPGGEMSVSQVLGDEIGRAHV